MITLSEFVWLVKTWKHNKGRRAARCLSCGVLDWWKKEVPPERRTCFYCWIAWEDQCSKS